MASDLLHIKDGYFFEFPTLLVRSNREDIKEFPDWFVRNDSEYQSYEADYIISELAEAGVDRGALAGLKERWENWKHASDANYAWPLDGYLDKQLETVKANAKTWVAAESVNAKDPVKAYLAENPSPEIAWYAEINETPELAQKWEEIKNEINGHEFVSEFKSNHSWDAGKIAEYNRDMHGKVMIPQPFGTLRNAYEPESGFCISRYMIIEVVVAILLVLVFSWLARRVRTGDAPKGKSWNLLESLTQGVRSQIVVPAMGEHDADRFMPFFYSLFFFILGCNLMGMIPFMGSPTAAFGSTIALAIMVLVLGMFLGIRQFGLLGYLKNICPDLGLPWYLAIVLVPMLWVIEAASMLIKHVVLAVRLLLNMSAGHLVMLGILGIGISAQAAELPITGWGAVAAISVIGTTLLSFLELFVAFLQAFVFTFLAAMLVGSAIHHH